MSKSVSHRKELRALKRALEATGMHTRMVGTFGVEVACFPQPLHIEMNSHGEYSIDYAGWRETRTVSTEAECVALVGKVVRK